MTWNQFGVILAFVLAWAAWASVGLISVQKSVALLEFSVFHKTAAARTPAGPLLSYPLFMTPEEKRD